MDKTERVETVSSESNLELSIISRPEKCLDDDVILRIEENDDHDAKAEEAEACFSDDDEVSAKFSDDDDEDTNPASELDEVINTSTCFIERSSIIHGSLIY